MIEESTPENPAFAEIPQLGQWLRAGKTTPTRLTAYFLDRLARLGPPLNAVVTVMHERGLAEAKRAEEELAAGMDRGPLHGIPYGVKDLLDAEGAPTTWGAAPYRSRIVDRDATVVRKLTEAGAVLIGKLATVELAGGMGYQQADATFTGPGLNPWNKTAWAGGSSSGPGAAVAAGLVPFAIGSETWGSIVTPASYCGVTAVRPTYGRVSRHGTMALTWTMDKIGPFARSAIDAGVVLEAIAGPDTEDLTTLPERSCRMAAALDRRYRFAVLKGGSDGLQPEVEQNFQASLELLRTVGDVAEVELPELPYDAAADIIFSAEMSSALEDWIGSDKVQMLQAPEDRIGGIANELIFAKDYIRALRIRGKAISALTRWLDGFDALVTPGTTAVAGPIASSFSDYFSRYANSLIAGPANLAGLPAVCIPNGVGERGLPTSLLFTGGPLTEPLLLRIAADIQEQTDWHRRQPPVSIAAPN